LRKEIKNILGHLIYIKYRVLATRTYFYVNVSCNEIKKRSGKDEKTRVHFLNISLLIVHCCLRDIVILTIHLFTRFI